MGKFVLKGVRLFAGAADLTSNTNKVELSSEVDVKDVTAFNPASTTEVWQEVLGGLASTKATGEGQWEALDASKVDDASWTNLAAVGSWTACPAGATEGNVAWLTKMMQGSYQLGDQVGEVAPWSADWSGSWPLVRGQVFHPPGTARTATGNGTGQQLGAALSTQAIYATVHILSVSGTTPLMTLNLESDDNSGFTSATARATFSGIATRAGLSVKAAGPVTDDWWRFRWTISGTSPSFLFVAAVGLGPA